jgi:iron complex transport system substrate-binding protein
MTIRSLTNKIFIFGFIFSIVPTCAPKDKEAVSETSPQRIISLAPNVTELLYALEQEDRLVGVTEFCSYPQEAVNKEKIGGLLNPNMEKIISLKPDLLIGAPTHHDLIKKLEQHRFQSILLANDSQKDILNSIDSLGKRLQIERKAKRLKEKILDSLKHYTKLGYDKADKKLAALFVLYRKFGEISDISVIGKNTFTSDIWERFGGVNAFRLPNRKYAKINTEAVLQMDPDIIIEFRIDEAWDGLKTIENFNDWKRKFPALKAVRQNNIFVLTNRYTLIPGPRMYLLAKDFAQILNL